MAMPFEEALACFELGRNLLDATGQIDGSDSDSHLRRACEIFEALDAQHELGRARRAIEKLS